ncbi:MAG: Arsenite methyltransferase, partial [Anaerocolumna sp.]|nr:Arsenite methyltransferase [Anaerocolumna sp.]
QEIKKAAEAWVGCIAGALSAEEYRIILEKVGFSNIEIKPVHIYTKDVVKDLLQEKQHLISVDFSNILDQVDGAFAGAYIKAIK